MDEIESNKCVMEAQPNNWIKRLASCMALSNAQKDFFGEKNSCKSFQQKKIALFFLDIPKTFLTHKYYGNSPQPKFKMNSSEKIVVTSFLNNTVSNNMQVISIQKKLRQLLVLGMYQIYLTTF